MSASRGAADQLAQGDAQGAADQLEALGEQADQLSDAARRRLPQVLDEAAAQTRAADPDLSAAERRAARGLAGSDYEEQRDALAELGQEVARAGDESRGQAGTEPGGAQPGAAEGAEGTGQAPGQPGQDGAGAPGNTGDESS